MLDNLKGQPLKVPIINRSHHLLPAYHSAGAAGFDVMANIDKPISIAPRERAMVPTGLYMAIPDGFEAQVRSRSGLAVKYGVVVLNSPGTIDSDYRGELIIILANLSDASYTVEDGDRIAQVILAPVQRVEWEEVSEHVDTLRGDGGFGHSGR